MGCGQSKIHLYPRKSKSKANGKKGGHVDSDAETDEDEGHIEDTEKYQHRDREKNDETEELNNKDSQDTDDEVSASLLRAKNLSLLQSQEISSSQQNFFRMLDKKIDEGPDYDSASETEIALEEARLNALVQHWESASLTASICSSASRSLQTTPTRHAPVPVSVSVKQLSAPRAILQTANILNTDFLPHGAPQSAQASSSSLKHPQNQQLLISHVNPKMLHPIAMVQQMPMNISGESCMTSSNTSNSTIIPVSNQSQQFTHLLALPGPGSPQLLGKPGLSPKRMMDAPRILMNPSPLAQQIHPTQSPNQFIPMQAISPAPSSYTNGGRTPQPPMPVQMTYFGQPTAQQSMQVASQHDQQTTQRQGHQAFYSDPVHSIQAPPQEYRFPPVISVQRLAPQVQRQLRETQELIKDSCPQLYAAGYGGSPGPPIRNQARNPTRRPTLETQFSQESS